MSTFQNLYSDILHLTKYPRTLPDQTSGNFLDFSSNDYLGLSKNQDVIKAASDAAQKYGVGGTGSRLLSGNFSLLNEFESRIAKDKGTETALIFNSGYQANQSILATLANEKYLNKKSILLFDKLNHASLYNAVANNELIRYPHQDLNKLIVILEKYSKSDRPKFIVTESLFGMDGDLSDVKKLYEIAEQFNAFLYLDEAHAPGVFVENGYGLVSGQENCLSMGTFSKGLGCSGAYIACSNIIKKYLLNYCPGIIYSTAVSPMVVGAAKAAWEMLPQFEEKRKSMLIIAKNLRQSLQAIGLETGLSNTHIIPIIMADTNQAVTIQSYLKYNGILVSLVRPPSVTSSRLRIALNTNHTESDIAKLIQILKSIITR